MKLGITEIDLLIASGNREGVVYLRDLRNPSRECQLTSEMDNWVRVEFSPSGDYLASISSKPGDDTEVVIWDISNLNWNNPEALRPIHVEKLDDSLGQIRWSPDGSQIAAPGSQGGYIWNTSTWQSRQFKNDHTEPVSGICWSPDGAKLACQNSYGSLFVVDVSTLSVNSMVDSHAGRGFEVAFSHDGMQLITANGDDTIGIWDIETRELRARLPGHRDGAKSLLLTADKKRLITGGLWDGKIRIWRLE